MPTPKQQAWIDSIMPDARTWSAQTGIPPEVYVAILASETNWGAAPTYFGIKGSGPNSRTFDTWEMINGQRVNVKDSFATYANPSEGHEHFIDLISKGRYAPAWKQFQETGDWQGLLQGINKAGYATDPNWSKNIASIASTIGGGPPSGTSIKPAPANPAPSRQYTNDQERFEHLTGLQTRGVKIAPDAAAFVKEYQSRQGAGGGSAMPTEQEINDYAQAMGITPAEARTILGGGQQAPAGQTPAAPTQGAPAGSSGPSGLPPWAREIGGNLASGTDPATGVTFYWQYNPNPYFDPQVGMIPAGWNPRGTPQNPAQDAATKPAGAVSEQELRSAGAKFGVGTATVGGKEYKKNPDGTYSVSGDVAQPKLSPLEQSARSLAGASATLGGQQAPSGESAPTAPATRPQAPQLSGTRPGYEESRVNYSADPFTGQLSPASVNVMMGGSPQLGLGPSSEAMRVHAPNGDLRTGLSSIGLQQEFLAKGIAPTTANSMRELAVKGYVGDYAPKKGLDLANMSAEELRALLEPQSAANTEGMYGYAAGGLVAAGVPGFAEGGEVTSFSDDFQRNNPGTNPFSQYGSYINQYGIKIITDRATGRPIQTDWQSVSSAPGWLKSLDGLGKILEWEQAAYEGSRKPQRMGMLGEGERTAALAANPGYTPEAMPAGYDSAVDTSANNPTYSPPIVRPPTPPVQPPSPVQGPQGPAQLPFDAYRELGINTLPGYAEGGGLMAGVMPSWGQGYRPSFGYPQPEPTGYPTAEPTNYPQAQNQMPERDQWMAEMQSTYQPYYDQAGTQNQRFQQPQVMEQSNPFLGAGLQPQGIPYGQDALFGNRNLPGMAGGGQMMTDQTIVGVGAQEAPDLVQQAMQRGAAEFMVGEPHYPGGPPMPEMLNIEPLYPPGGGAPAQPQMGGLARSIARNDMMSIARRLGIPIEQALMQNTQPPLAAVA